MVHSSVLVRGVVIDQETFLSVFKEKLRENVTEEDEPWDESKFQNLCVCGEVKCDVSCLWRGLCKTMNISNCDLVCDLYSDFCCENDFVFNYPSSSKLNGKKWVVGVEILDISHILITEFSIEDMTADTSVNKKWHALAETYGLSDLTPKTYIMPICSVC